MPNGNNFLEGKMVIIVIALGKLINMALSVNGHLLQNSKYYYVNTYSIVLLGILTVVTNLIFIPKWGILGAAIASALSLVVFNLVKFLFILYKFKMHPFSLMTVPAVIIILLTSFINFLELLLKLSRLHGLFRLLKLENPNLLVFPGQLVPQF